VERLAIVITLAEQVGYPTKTLPQLLFSAVGKHGLSRALSSI